jgi:hypothetical protein
MGLFSRKTSDAVIDPSWMRATGLVIQADAPPQSAPSHGPDSQGRIRAVIDIPSQGRRQLHAVFTFADAHWVAPGMQVPVAIDPARPDTFVVDWAAVPPMRQQAEASHPALADPFAASRGNAAALGITPSEKTAAVYERLQRMVAEAAAKPAPPGQQRAVAVVATIRGRFWDGSDPDGGSSSGRGVTLNMNSEAVLSVAVPGRSPYAVYVPKFKFPRKHPSVPGEPLPALVATTDPQDITIVWDEVPGIDEFIATRMADSAQAHGRETAALRAQFEDAQAAALARAGYPQPGAPMPGMPAPGIPTPGMPAPGMMPPEMRAMMVANLKRAMQAMPNAAQRQMVLDQYRRMGLEITQEELGF